MSSWREGSQAELEVRARGFLRNADWLQMLKECAQEGGTLADELANAHGDRLRETGEHIRRAADYAAAARTSIRLADQTLLGAE